MTWRSDRAGKRIACAAIVAAAAVGLGLSVHHDVQLTDYVTTKKFAAGASLQVRQAECVFDAIRQKVPEGATIYIANHGQPLDHLVEWSTPWAVPEDNVADAQYRLTLVPTHGHRLFPFPLTKAAPDPAKGLCAGLTVEVSRL